MTAIWLAGVASGALMGFVFVTVVSAMVAAQNNTTRPAGVTHVIRPYPNPPQPDQPKPDQPPGSLEAERNVCYTRSCVDAADYLRRNLNTLVAPCSNFREYACGRYQGADSVLQDMKTSLWRVGAVHYMRRLRESGKEWEQTNRFGSAAMTLHSIDQGVLRKALQLIEEKKLEGSRKKAMIMAQLCYERYVVDEKEAEFVEDLRNLMKGENLDVKGPPSGVDTRAEQLLVKHVHLAFTYMLSGLIRILPSTPGCLMVNLDTAVAERTQFYKGLSEDDKINYFKALAAVAGASDDMLKQCVALHDSVTEALASAAKGVETQSEHHGVPSIMATKADEVVIEGLGPQAFADAVATQTPYPRDAAVDLDKRVPSALASVWRRLGLRDLYLWTGWNVLQELIPYVRRTVAHIVGAAAFYERCITRVKQAMAAPFAATALLLSKETRNGVEQLTRAVISCLAVNASRWVRPPRESTKGADVVVGFPPNLDSLDKLNSHYATYLEDVTVNPRFLWIWRKAMKERERQLRPSDVHFDPSDVDIMVSRDGQVIVPAGAVHAFYRDNAVPAVTEGILGHIIARRLVQRLMRRGVPPKPECLAPSGSKAVHVYENLLAHHCAQHVVAPKLDMNTSAAPWLPMHMRLTAPMQFFTMACLKDCRNRRHDVEGSCETGALRKLRSFNDAFGCLPVTPMCELL
ncbi:uncharacterized protein LOC144095258 [Amblyomma americanum]